MAFTIVSPAWDYTSLIPFEFPGWNFSILEPLAIERTNFETEDQLCNKYYIGASSATGSFYLARRI